jgi:TPP-dependent pyruvate/acetoin dehydrogenase alpha subunit
MPGTHTIEPSAGAPLGAGPPTRPERVALLRALLLGRALERALPRIRHGATAGADPETVLTAIAAASALHRDDRLIVPHGLLCAHLAAGIDPAAVARARLGLAGGADGLITGVGPEGPAALAVGVAFALRSADSGRCAVALMDRRWAETDGCRAALALAHEQRLPMVLVAIDSAIVAEHAAPAVNGYDFEAVRAAVRTSIEDAHADRGASLVVSSRVEEATPERRRPLFRTEVNDPLAAYERRLLVNGFSRADLSQIHDEAGSALRDALAAPELAGRRAG